VFSKNKPHVPARQGTCKETDQALRVSALNNLGARNAEAQRRRGKGEAMSKHISRRRFLKRLGKAAPFLIWPGATFGKSCGPPPPARPHRIKGGEGFPPLPLPVTPLRRTEKKRPPSPPTLAVKVKLGSGDDWTTDPGDIKRLLDMTSGRLELPYTSREMSLGEFNFEPAESPILYFTGHEAVSFTSAQRRKLREYAILGGTVWGDACCGAKPFADSFRREMSLIFPDRPLSALPLDHPLYSIYHQIGRIRYKKEKEYHTDLPSLEAAHIGCRAAVVSTPYDLSCGWDGHTHEHGQRVDIQDAQRIGTNMVAYALAYYRSGLMFSHRVQYKKKEGVADSDFFVGHLKHGGDWNPDPDGLQNLMLEVENETKVKVNFKVKEVDPLRSGLFSCPFLYMSGHDSFSFTDAERSNLRQYLSRGGFLLADSCCGRAAFDAAFRKEMSKIFPNKKLELLPADSELYNLHYKLESTAYSPRVTATEPGLAGPHLEGIAIDGKLVVVYSKYDLGCRWERIPHPHTLAVEMKDAFEFGINGIIYAMTH